MYSIKFHFKAGQRAPGLRRVAGRPGKGAPRSLSLWGLVGWARKHKPQQTLDLGLLISRSWPTPALGPGAAVVQTAPNTGLPCTLKAQGRTPQS